MNNVIETPVVQQNKPGVSGGVVFRLFAGLFLIFGVAVAVLTFKDLVPFFTHDSTGIVKALWQQDIENISENESVPDGWLHLKEVNFQSAPAKEELMNKSKPFIPTHTDGTHRLSIFFDDWKESDTHVQGALIQYSLYNIKTGNLEWELSRTLPLSKAYGEVP